MFRRVHHFFYPRSPCGERLMTMQVVISLSFFYPRSPCGERHDYGVDDVWPIIFSIHALLAESDLLNSSWISSIKKIFYPRSPCGERLGYKSKTSINKIFSIHALLAESDPSSILRPVTVVVFLSTLSLRRATSLFCPCWNSLGFSIHALLAESDLFFYAFRF